jgi:NADH:ubiquinone oxidoreductase subunit K
MLGIYLSIVGSIIFCISFGIIVAMRKSFLMTIICLESMLLSVNLVFIGFSYFWQNTLGQIMVLLVMSIGAVEIVIGLAILVVHYHVKGSIFVDN